MTIPSPCTANCALDTDFRSCTACGRTLPEIESWPTATDEEKYAILRRLSQQRPTPVMPAQAGIHDLPEKTSKTKKLTKNW